MVGRVRLLIPKDRALIPRKDWGSGDVVTEGLWLAKQHVEYEHAAHRVPMQSTVAGVGAISALNDWDQFLGEEAERKGVAAAAGVADPDNAREGVA